MYESGKDLSLEAPLEHSKEGAFSREVEQRFMKIIKKIDKSVEATSREVEASGVNSRELLRTGAAAKTAGNQDLRNRFGI